MKIDSLKLQITINVLKFHKTKDEKYKLDVLSDLNTFAKFYHHKVKKVQPIETLQALIEFIEANKPVDVCINRLYYSLT